MAKLEEHSQLTILIGISAIIATFIMATGEWSIFDVGVALSMIVFGLYFLQIKNGFPENKWEIAIATLAFGILSTAAAIALLSTLVPILLPFIPKIAAIDINSTKNYFAVPEGERINHYRDQSVWQCGLFLIFTVAWATVFGRTYLRRKRYKEIAKSAKA